MRKFKGFLNGKTVSWNTKVIDGVICRDDTLDAYIVDEVKGAYGWLDFRGRSVMDIGANIGAFAVMAKVGGAGKLVCYEPNKANFALLEANSPTSINFLAGIASTDREGDLWAVPNGLNQGSFSMFEMRGRQVCTTNAKFHSFKKQLHEYRPSVLKIDCESGEHEFLKEPLPKFVKQVAVEIHFGRKEWLESAARIVELFKDWEVVREPTIIKGRWHTLAGWRR